MAFIKGTSGVMAAASNRLMGVPSLIVVKPQVQMTATHALLVVDNVSRATGGCGPAPHPLDERLQS